MADEKPQEATSIESGTNPTPAAMAPIPTILRRWKRDDLLKKGCFIARSAALVFSLISFVVMASNKHGDWRNFDKYEEFKYCLAISILAFLYTGMQVSVEMYRNSTKRDVVSPQTSVFVGFAGDQIVAYLLLSAASTAAGLTNRMREGADNLFTDAAAASISMAFLAFFALALSALISGFKLSKQSYI